MNTASQQTKLKTNQHPTIAHLRFLVALLALGPFHSWTSVKDDFVGCASMTQRRC